MVFGGLIQLVNLYHNIIAKPIFTRACTEGGRRQVLSSSEVFLRPKVKQDLLDVISESQGIHTGQRPEPILTLTDHNKTTFVVFSTGC